MDLHNHGASDHDINQILKQSQKSEDFEIKILIFFEKVFKITKGMYINKS